MFSTVTVNCSNSGSCGYPPARLAFADDDHLSTVRSVKERLSELWAVEPSLLKLVGEAKEELEDEKSVKEIIADSGEVTLWATVEDEAFLRKNDVEYGHGFVHASIESCVENYFLAGDEVVLGSSPLMRMFGDGWEVVNCVMRGPATDYSCSVEFDLQLTHCKPYDLQLDSYERYLDLSTTTTKAFKFSFEDNLYVSIPCIPLDRLSDSDSDSASWSESDCTHRIAFSMVEETEDCIRVKSAPMPANAAVSHPLEQWNKFICDCEDEMSDELMDKETSHSPVMQNLWEKHQKRLIGCVVSPGGTLVKARRMDEGIYLLRACNVSNNVEEKASDTYTGICAPPPELIKRLNQQIDVLKVSEPPDYHPGSLGIVRDLVHPSMYPYVNPKQNEASTTKRDFWGRPYEKSKFQWLPSEFHIDQESGKCVIESYINNLDRGKYGDLYQSLAELFDHALPLLEACYFEYCSKVKDAFVENALNPDDEVYDDDDYVDTDIEADFSEDKAPLPKKGSFRGKTLQIIPKIVDYELLPDQIHEGVWHVEGMSHESIIATALYILDKDADLVGGNLLYKRAYLSSEVGKILVSVPQTRPRSWGNVVEFGTGLQPLGTVVLPQGTLAVWPNSHVHRLTKLCSYQMIGKETSEGELEADEQEAVQETKSTAEETSAERPAAKQRKQSFLRRRIVLFWLVNPETRIVSTKDIPPQQGVVSLDKALEMRMDLMMERSRHKQNWNIRRVALCEH